MTKTPCDQALCVLYLRLSEGRELASLKAREKALRAEAARRGWQVTRVVIENDLATGKSRNASAFKRRTITLPDGRRVKRVVRPGFRSILVDLYTRRAHALLAEDLDRVVRDPRDGEDLLEVVELTKATADSLSGSLRLTNGGTDNEVYAFRAAVNHANKSSKDTSRRNRDARERQAAEGIWGGGRRPYGFTPVPHPEGRYQNTRLVVDAVEAVEIRRAAEQVLTDTFGRRGGISLKGIARDMRERGVPTVTGTLWTAETLRDVLLRPINAGIVVYNGKETDVRLPGDPILPEDIWRAVVAKVTDPERNTRGRAACWLGTGVYRCVCGSPMEIQGGRGRARSYRCAREGGIGDVHVRRNAQQLDAYVTVLAVERLSNDGAMELMAKKGSRVDVKALRQQANALREVLDELARDRADRVITRDQMLAGTKRAKARLEQVEAQLAAATDVPVLATVAGAKDMAVKWDTLTLGQRRAVISALFTVTVLPAQRRGRGFDPDSVGIDPPTVQDRLALAA